MTATLIIGLLIAIGTLILDLSTDYRLWKRKQIEGTGIKDVNHRLGLIIRLLGLIPASILIGWPDWKLMLASLFLIGAIYWLLFDGIYNLLRKFKFFFTGSDDPDDAVSDNFLQRIPLWLHITIKFGLIALAIYVVTLVN